MSLDDYAGLPEAVDGVGKAVDGFNAELEIYEKAKKTILHGGAAPSRAAAGKGQGAPAPGAKMDPAVPAGAQSFADSLAHLDAVLAGLGGEATVVEHTGDQTFKTGQNDQTGSGDSGIEPGQTIPGQEENNLDDLGLTTPGPSGDLNGFYDADAPGDVGTNAPGAGDPAGGNGGW